MKREFSFLKAVMQCSTINFQKWWLPESSDSCPARKLCQKFVTAYKSWMLWHLQNYQAHPYLHKNGIYIFPINSRLKVIGTIHVTWCKALYNKGRYQLCHDDRTITKCQFVLYHLELEGRFLQIQIENSTSTLTN